MNLGDYFEQVEFHTEFNNVDQMIDAQASDLAKININDLKSLIDDYHAGCIHSVDDLNKEFLKWKEKPGIGRDYLEQSGLIDFVPVNPLRYIRCGHCRWYWQPGTSFDNKCPHCGFVAMLKTYTMQVRHETTPKQNKEKDSGNYFIEFQRLLDIDDKTLTKSLSVPMPFKKLICISYSVKTGRLPIEEAHPYLQNAYEALLTYGYQGIVSGLANFKKHFPTIAAVESDTLDRVLKVAEENKSALKKLDGKCFIATAAYGNPNAWEVRVLRSWRDQFLRHFAAGQLFICLYEHLSPPLAAFIGRHFWARRLFRPAIWTVATAITLSRQTYMKVRSRR